MELACWITMTLTVLIKRQFLLAPEFYWAGEIFPYTRTNSSERTWFFSSLKRQSSRLTSTIKTLIIWNDCPVLGIIKTPNVTVWDLFSPYPGQLLEVAGKGGAGRSLDVCEGFRLHGVASYCCFGILVPILLVDQTHSSILLHLCLEDCLLLIAGLSFRESCKSECATYN